MSALSELLSLPDAEKASRGLTHTPAEIAQQPDTWLSTFELFRKHQPRIVEFLSAAGLSANSTSKPAVFLVGAGTSDYVGRAFAELLRKLWRCEVNVVPSTDLLTRADDRMLPPRKSFCISFSRSGGTAEGVAVLEKLRRSRPDVHHLVISCNAESRMIRENATADNVLAIALDDAVNDRGLAMTSSFSNMVVFGQCLAHAENIDGYRRILSQLAEAGRGLLPQAADCAAAVAKGPFTKACFVGSGPLRVVAKESALKVVELTAGKTFTMSESALGLRHGPLAALDDETVFVCFLSGDPRVQKYEHDLLDDVAKKNLVKCSIVVAGSEAQNSRAQYNLAPPVSIAVDDDYRPVVDVILGQLLGLFFSMRWNLQPDSPSPNGAITRVVENLKIYG